MLTHQLIENHYTNLASSLVRIIWLWQSLKHANSFNCLQRNLNQIDNLF